MKRFGISAVLGTAVLFLIFGTPAPTQAFQEEHPQDAKPAEAKPAPKEESKPPKDAKPAPKPKQESKPPQDAKPTTHDQEAKPPKEDKPPKDTNAHKAANAPKESKDARPAEHAEKSTVKHGPLENGRIPDAQFHSHFGHEHTFKVGHPVVVEGQSRFQFGGYWFGFSEAWPVGWAYTDDVYVDYIDGEYFLIDPVHPGLRLQLIVVV
ncbi:MAG TPA: hypothetical protein VN861_09025 [Candidatus Acidoferrales bacterium]|nr:hypothetical protein [Candidatus Acidoferrales bacterium]